MLNRSVKSFVPTVYDRVVEIDELMNAEESMMDLARREMYSAFANTFVLTADELGVIMFEKMLSIVPNTQTEDLEFRRQRIINRLSMSPPFTFTFLKHRLDEIIGVNAWKAYVDQYSYTLYVESSAINQSWYSEAEFTINQVKPCNLVFINVPFTSASVKLSEQISYKTLKWWYQLGSWKLGQKPFASQDGGGIIKMPETKSIQTSLLNDTASFLASDISSVLINDSVEITQFSVKSASDNTVSVEYVVAPNMTNLMSNIKLRKADGTVLTEVAVYVPVSSTVMGKHLITVKEGV